ncbi:methionyl-tRNA formyltransferase [Porphyrobacter algicida]|uniref:Methionyl-tRNA formyltransferase n=1 Tax=Qipengyuania algicida TaxID=1836209 RepID=A0A845AQE2_9SPHN|nr:methionyl-tRNA formyltransferase [Qipengyuania algicida]MXP29148.1 methionyl-tRNA formyltransferase [Qipengyuania algicida]
MRIIFMGTPDFAVPTLAALHDAAHEILCVYTQPPRPAGRGKKLQPSPVQREAEVRHLEVRSPTSLKSPEEQARFAALEADLAVVAAYGLILPQPILDAPRFGCLNVHASLLPRWRGAAPVQRAILAGDTLTGITLMQMESGLDTGPMLATARVQIERKNAGELTAELADVGAQLMVGTLTELQTLHAVAQDDDEATYASKIDKAESRIDWSQEAEQVERQVRAFAPAPGAWFEFEGERYRILSAECAEGGGAPGTVLDDQLTIACDSDAIRPITIQRAGKPAMETAALLRGKPIPAGTILS